MRILRNYVLKEFTLPFFLSLSVLIFVMLLGNIIKLVGLIINKGVSFFSIAKLFIFLIPYLLTYTVPIAVLSAVLLSLGRLSSDNEIIAIRASGINIFRLITPLLIFGLVLSLGLVILNDKVIPRAHFETRKTLVDIGISNPTAALEAGTFIDTFQKYVIFIYAIDRNKQTGERNILNNVRIYEPQGKDKPTRTIIARSGEFVSLPEKKIVKLKLLDVISDEPDIGKPGEFFKLNSKTYFMTLNLSDQDEKGEIGKKPKDMTIKELKIEIKRLKELTQEDPTPLFAQIHQRVSLAFSALIFILVACPLAVITHRREKTLNFGLAFLIAGIYYLFLISFESLALQGKINPALAMWLPNIILTALGLFLMLKLTKK